jgi:hypothetical protein
LRAATANVVEDGGRQYGVKGIDHIAAPSRLKSVIAGSYPSGPSSMGAAADLAAHRAHTRI